MASAGLGPYVNNEFQYIAVETGVNVDWSFTTNGQDQGPSVSYDDIKLELGPAISQFVTPIIKDIQEVIAPIEPILKVLQEPIPGLTDLSHLVGGGNVTILSLAEKAASLDLFGPGFDQLVQLAGTIVTILNDVEQFQTAGNTLALDVGSFSLPESNTQALLDNNYENDFTNGTDPGLPLTFNTASTNPLITDMQDVANKVPGLSMAEQTGLKDLQMFLSGNEGISLNFPILDNPTSILFPLLLDQGNADFVTFDAHLNLPADATFPFASIFGLNLNLVADLNFTFNVQAGYDTQGIRDMIADHFAPSKLLPDFLDGFYVSTGTITSLNASFAVQLGASAGLFSVYVNGGIYTGNGIQSANISHPEPLTVTLTGGSGGKVRPSSFNSSSAPAFQAEGEVDAGLDISAKFGVSILGNFVGFEDDFNIATVKLLSFGENSSLESSGPTLATWVNQSEGILELANLGPNETITVAPDTQTTPRHTGRRGRDGDGINPGIHRRQAD